jgi:hypothetical protein
MGLIITLIIWVVLAAVIVWIADWTARPQTALDFLIGAFAAARLTGPNTTRSVTRSVGN